MSIFDILRKNFSAASRTHRPDDLIPCPQGFRGVLEHDLALCTGCHTCAYVCSPSAISFDQRDATAVIWQYDSGRCTYCSKCAEYCPTGAIRLQETLQNTTTERTQQHIAHRVAYQSCARCGQPVIPMPEPVLAKFYGGETPAEVIQLHKLCERCRKRVSSEKMKGLLD